MASGCRTEATLKRDFAFAVLILVDLIINILYALQIFSICNHYQCFLLSQISNCFKSPIFNQDPKYKITMNLWNSCARKLTSIKTKAIFKLKTIFSSHKSIFRWTLGLNVAALLISFAYYSDRMNFLLTKQTQLLSDIEIPASLRNYLFTLFAHRYNVNLEEVELPLTQYPTLSSFFIRKITRPPGEGVPNTISSPCDGKVLSFQQVTQDKCHIIKGHSYSLTELLLGQRLKGSDPIHTYVKKDSNNKLYQIIIYLAPGDYHRFHSPTQMEVRKTKEIEGQFDPVNEKSILTGKKVYETNARVCLFSQWKQGLLAMALVGALNVSRIMIVNKTRFSRADELGYFNLGSTIVMLIEMKGLKEWKVKQGDKVQYGQPILEYLV